MVAAYGTAEAVQLLIDAGADLNVQEEEGRTALMLAAQDCDSKDCNSKSSIEAVKVLLQAGADLSIRSKDGRTALMLAATSECKTLLAEAEKKQTTAKGETTSHLSGFASRIVGKVEDNWSSFRAAAMLALVVAFLLVA